MAVQIQAQGGIYSADIPTTIPLETEISLQDINNAKALNQQINSLAAETQRVGVGIDKIACASLTSAEFTVRESIQKSLEQTPHLEFANNALQTAIESTEKTIEAALRGRDVTKVMSDGTVLKFTINPMQISVGDPTQAFATSQNISDRLATMPSDIIHLNDKGEVILGQNTVEVQAMGNIAMVKAASDVEIKYGDKLVASLEELTAIRSKIEEAEKLDPVEHRQAMVDAVNELAPQIIQNINEQNAFLAPVFEQARANVIQQGIDVQQAMMFASQNNFPAIAIPIENEMVVVVKTDQPYIDPKNGQVGQYLMFAKDDNGKIDVMFMNEQQASFYVKQDVEAALGKRDQSIDLTKNAIGSIVTSINAYINAPEQQVQIYDTEVQKGITNAGMEAGQVQHSLGVYRDYMVNVLDSIAKSHEREVSGEELRYTNPNLYSQILHDGANFIPALGAIQNPVTGTPLQLADIDIVSKDNIVLYEIKASNGSKFQIQYDKNAVDLEGKIEPVAMYHSFGIDGTGEKVCLLPKDFDMEEVVQNIKSYVLEDLEKQGYGEREQENIKEQDETDKEME